MRVCATLAEDGEAIDFSVADTGIGIAAADQQRIFEEFGQVEGPLQGKVKGTGLGLPLTRRLTELLGGRITLVSEPGVGSTFTARIPIRYTVPEPPPLAPTWQPDARLDPVLIVEDSAEDVLVYEKFLRGSRFQPVAVSTLSRAREVLRRLRPVAVILDIRLRGEDTWSFLSELKRREDTRDVPVLVITTVPDPHKGLGLGADAYAVKPVERVWLLDTLGQVTGPERRPVVLVIDDDETSRYLVRTSLADSAYAVVEAPDGREGLRRAREVRPVAIFLDLVMPGATGFEVLEQLRDDPATRGIPVVVLTSKVLAPPDAAWLHARAAAVLSKARVGRDTIVRALAQALTGQPEVVE